MKRQQTIRQPVSAGGIEFHAGQQSTVWLQPKPIDSGISMKVKGVTVGIGRETLATAHRSTTSIEVGNTIISSVEHLLSALFGLGVTNLCIEVVKGSEIPILDGSAQSWVDLILEPGLQQQDAVSVSKNLTKKVEFRHGQSEYVLIPANNFAVDVEIDFPQTVIGKQNMKYLHTTDNYCSHVAAARTFIGDGANGMQLDRKKILDRLKSVDIATPDSCPCILYEKMSYITPLRFANEPVAHKLLDFLGDFSLLGSNVNCKIKAVRPSHKANQLLVQKLVDEKLFL